jgi:hypothetical protein
MDDIGLLPIVRFQVPFVCIARWWKLFDVQQKPVQPAYRFLSSANWLSRFAVF